MRLIILCCRHCKSKDPKKVDSELVPGWACFPFARFD